MEDNNQSKNSKKVKVWMIIGFVLVFIGLMFLLFSGENLKIIKSLFRSGITKEEVQDSLSNLGIRAYLVFGILSVLQVVITFIPAEPIQVMAGLSLGFWRGTLVCIIGIIIGNTIIYLLHKVYGQKLTKYFKTNAEFDFETAAKSSKLAIIVIILGLLPAIPYGLIAFFAASLGIKYPRYMFLTVLGTIPSVFFDVGMGHIAIASSWLISVIVFVAIIIVVIILAKKRAVIFKKVNQYVKSHVGKVKRCNKFVYNSVV